MEQELLVDYLHSLNPNVPQSEIRISLEKPKSSFPVKVSAIPYNGPDGSKEITDRILIDNKQFESEESRITKETLLASLQQIVTKWSIDVAEKEKQIYRVSDQLQHYSAVLVPYGSQLLGVTSQESDLDLICVAPAFLDRKMHFFKGLYEVLESQPYVTKINKIEASANPIIKLYYKGSSVDINFAQINRDVVPKNIDDELDDLRRTILNTEKQSIDALNGRKNGLMIRNSVTNERSFVDSLRIIKLWSKKRGISSNMIGYLGGISWAILVAKICQLFPTLNGHQIVYMFFKCYTLWDWQKQVIIDAEDHMVQLLDPSLQSLQPRSSEVYMNITTPACPYINSAQKVNLINYKTLGRELARGLEILDNTQMVIEQRWDKLFEQFTLIDNFKYFLTISIVSNNVPDFHRWSGFCEAQLVQLTENISNYLFYGRFRGQNQNEIDEYIYLDDSFNTTKDIKDKFELRISQNGVEDQEPDYQISNTYFIGIKKLDQTSWPLFLSVPVQKFADRIYKNKLKLKWESDDNLKIYFQNKSQLQMTQPRSPKQAPQVPKEMKKETVEFVEPPVQKKVKLECPNSAELVKHNSIDQRTFDNDLLTKTLDDLF